MGYVKAGTESLDFLVDDVDLELREVEGVTKVFMSFDATPEMVAELSEEGKGVPIPDGRSQITLAAFSNRVAGNGDQPDRYYPKRVLHDEEQGTEVQVGFQVRKGYDYAHRQQVTSQAAVAAAKKEASSPETADAASVG